MKDRPYYFKFDAEKAFNRSPTSIATLAMNDSHPGNLEARDWLWIAKDDMGWRYAANLVMSLVYAILFLKDDRPEQIEYVLELMKGQDYGEDYFEDFETLARLNEKRYEIDLALHPVPVEELKQTL